MENQKKEKEITFGYLIEVFKKSFIFMLLAAILFGAIGVVYSKFIERPRYQSTASFMVKNISPESYYTSGLTMASTSIASSCVEFANHQNPRLMIANYNDLWQKLGYDNAYDCADAIDSMIVAKKGSDENACSFYITVKSGNRDVTYEIISAIENVFPNVVQDIFGNDNKEALATLKVEYEAELIKLNVVENANSTAIEALNSTYESKKAELEADATGNAEALLTLKEEYEAKYKKLQEASAKNQDEIEKLEKAYIQDAAKLESTDKTNVESLVASTSTISSAEAVLTVKSSPLKIGFILAVVAAVITYCVFFVKALFDKSIYDEESVKENFSYPIVGVIPSFATAEEQAEMKKFKKKKSDQAVAPRN